MNKPFIIYRNQRVYFDIPSNWRLLTFADFHESPSKPDVKKLTKQALEEPIGTTSLLKVLSPSDKVAIIVEDLTRASPKGLVLEILLEEIERAEVPDKNIAIVIALGTHRPLTPDELESTFGHELLRRYRFINHDCHAEDLMPIGKLSTGKPVKINRSVYEATFKIGIGSIFPHPMNGFGGGGKILFPGVADFESILDHHLKFTFHQNSELGQTKDNFFYGQVCDLSKSASLNFVINSILNQSDHVFDIVAGDPIQAHLRGIEKSKHVISRQFHKKADLTVITSFPYKEGPQLMKALSPASIVTRSGGCIVLVVECSGDLPEAFVNCFEKFHSKYGEDLYGAVLEHFQNGRLIMEDGAVDLNMALAMALSAQHHYKIILVSQDIPREVAERMGFLYADELEKAFEMSQRICPDPEVNIIPSGGVILPIL